MILKGEVCIQLKNTKTGKVREFKDKNLVTHAIRDISRFSAAQYGGGSYSTGATVNGMLMPIATNALGGLAVFAEEINGDADNYAFGGLSANKLLAFCGNGASSEYLRGTYNTLESGKTETGFRSVWDFSTSQCNGTIKALGRMGVYAGNNIYSGSAYPGSVRDRSITGASSGYELFPNNYNIVKYDYNTQTFYAVDVSISSPSGGRDVTFTLYKRYAPKYKYKVYETNAVDFMGDIEQVGNSFTVNVPFYCNNWSSSNNDFAQYFSVSLLDNCAYFLITAQFSVSGMVESRLVKLDLSTFEFSLYKTLPSMFNGQLGAKMTDRYCYFVKSTSNNGGTKSLVIVNLSDLSVLDVTDIPAQTMRPLAVVGDSIILTTASNIYYVHPDGSTDLIDSSFADTRHNMVVNRFDKLLSQSYNSDNVRPCVGLRTDYMGTIYNLLSPVTKTAQDTMKIIYTLTDATEEP